MRGWLLYGVLLLVATVLAVAAGGQVERDSPVPSVRNRGPLGAAVLWTYLEESGFSVRINDAAWTFVPFDALRSEGATFVVTAPQARRIKTDDAERLRAFVEGGGRLVLLAPLPKNGESQEALSSAFGYARATPWTPPALNVAWFDTDPAGASAEMLAAFGPLEGARNLRVTGAHGIAVHAEGANAVPLARTSSGAVAWFARLGKGELWLFAGADVIENRRLELEDNLRFWHALAARGPLVFDEHHHHPDEIVRTPVALWVVGAQLLAVFAAFVIARGQRLGPARPEPAQVHRSMKEYLSSFAWLTRRARVEPELCRELHARFRVLLHERQGILLSLPDDEAARELELRSRIPAAETQAALRTVKALAAMPEVTPKAFARAARELARLERIVTGRHDGRA